MKVLARLVDLLGAGHGKHIFVDLRYPEKLRDLFIRELITEGPTLFVEGLIMIDGSQEYVSVFLLGRGSGTLNLFFELV